MIDLKVTSAGSLELHFCWLTFTSGNAFSRFIIEWDTGMFVIMSDSSFLISTRGVLMRPDFWLGVIEPNENVTYYPLLGSFDEAKKRAASLASHTDSVDRVIVYSGYFKPEDDIAPSSALILATYSSQPFNQSTQYRGKLQDSPSEYIKLSE